MTAYYHGGVRRLKVGDRILPPDQTGARSMADLTTAPDEMRAQLARVHRTDRVYLTTDPAAARIIREIQAERRAARDAAYVAAMARRPVVQLSLEDA